MSFFSCFNVGKSSTPATPPPSKGKSKPLPTPVQKKTNSQANNVKTTTPTKTTPITVRLATPQDEAKIKDLCATHLENRKKVEDCGTELDRLKQESLGHIDALLKEFPNIEAKLDNSCPEHTPYFKELAALKAELLQKQSKIRTPNSDLVKENLVQTMSKVSTLEYTVDTEVFLRVLISDQEKTTAELSSLVDASIPRGDEMLRTLNQLTGALKSIRSQLLSSQNIIENEQTRNQLVTNINDLKNKYDRMNNEIIRPAIAKK